MGAELAVVFPRAGVSGGVERVTLDFLTFEAQRRSTCFVGETCEVSSVEHVDVRPLRVPAQFRPLTFRRAARSALRDLEVGTTVSMGVNCPPGDVLWVHSVHAAWLENGGDMFYRGHRVPSGIRRLLPQHQVLLRLERDYFVNHSARAILCTSHREIDDLARLYGVSRDLMHVVPNGYDSALFSVERRWRMRPEMRASLHATPDDIVLLMVANEWHRKGLGVLLGAVARMRDRRLRIDLVGIKSPQDYLAMADNLGIADRVHWHGPSNDVARFHAAADVFVLPTTYEPFGLVIIEAMASGLPVITSAIAGASDAIEPGVSGELLTDPRSVDELVAAVQRLISYEVRDELGTAAAHAAHAYDRETVMAQADRAIFPPVS